MLVNKTQLAKELGCTPAYITKISRPGGILKFSDGKIDLNIAKKIIEDNKDPSRPSQKQSKLDTTINPDDDIDMVSVESINNINFIKASVNDIHDIIKNYSFNDTRTAKEKMNLLIGKIDLDIKMKDLVDRSVVERQAFEIAKIFKDSVLSIPDRICDQIARESDASVVANILDKELKDCLNELIKKMNGLEF